MSDSPALFGRVDVQEGVVTVALVGPTLGERESGVITGMVQEALDRQAPRAVVLDFADVNFMNSSGIGGCVDIHNRAKRIGATTVLYRLTPEIEAVLKATRLDKLFAMTSDEKKLEKIVRKA